MRPKYHVFCSVEGTVETGSRPRPSNNLALSSVFGKPWFVLPRSSSPRVEVGFRPTSRIKITLFPE